MKLLKEVLKEIKPSGEEELEFKNKIDEVLKRINKNIKNAKAILGGSGAKGTWLKGTNEADLFVLFDYGKFKDKSAELSDFLEKVLKKSFKNVKRLHGSRDYFQVKKDGFKFEIIPILEIKKAGEAKNITDISPLHAKWVNKNDLKDEIRLTKQFCKANNVYGAESYIKGFSGYICEILTINYRGFLKLVKNAAKWKEKEIIDVNNYYKKKNDILFVLNKSKIYSPLIVIDPVQKDRNASAALSKEKFYLFREKCKEFVKKPSIEFFEKKKIDIEELKRKNKDKKLILLDVVAKTGKEDIIGAKLLKALKYIKRGLLFYEFRLYDYGWEWDKGKKALFYFTLDKNPLSETMMRLGPPLRAKAHVMIFKKRHKRIYVRNNRLYAEIDRKFREPEELIKELIKSDYVKERVKEIKSK